MASLGTIGKYELLKQLAVGGMAEIFLARQSGPESFSKLVVIKRILPNLVGEQRFVQMFLDEARVAARFNHPNIVQIFDLGREEDHYYIAMEYVHGEDIKSIVRRCALRHRRIPVEHVVKITSGVMDGLHYAHNQKTLDDQETGVVHRDVSPHNIILSLQGAVKLVDFGVAKARSQIATTLPGRVKGKHAYMSPEQVRAELLDGRSDVFSAGVVMYELLTWSRLFKRKRHLETLRAVTDAEIVPPRQLNPEVDEELQRIVLKALQRDRNQRYQTAQQMQIDLEEYLHTSGLRSNPILLSRFMAELFADKIETQEKALSVANAENLERAVLTAGEQGPDLVAFLDMFFSDAGSSPGHASLAEMDESSAPGSTPSDEPTQPGRRRRAAAADGVEPAPKRARGGERTGRAPPSKAPGGMAIQHPPPGPRQGKETVAVFRPRRGVEGRGVGPPVRGFPAEGLGPVTPDESLESELEPRDYSSELDPLGTRRRGKGVATVLIIALVSGAAVLLYLFKDELTHVEASSELGLVKVSSIPGGADVYLDNVHQLARTPMEIDGIRVGEPHQLKVSLPGHPMWETRFSLTDTAQPLLIQAVLDQQEADRVRMRGKPIIAGIGGDGTARLHVNSVPRGALIYLDGVSTNKTTPAVLEDVPAGLEHVLLVETRGKAPAYDRLYLADGDEKRLQFRLQRANERRRGRIAVRFETEPEGAKVRINGFPMAKPTPMMVSMQLGKASEVELEHERIKKKAELKVRPVPNVDLTIFSRLK